MLSSTLLIDCHFSSYKTPHGYPTMGDSSELSEWVPIVWVPSFTLLIQNCVLLIPVTIVMMVGRIFIWICFCYFFNCVFLFLLIILKNASLPRTVTPALPHLWDQAVALLCEPAGRVIMMAGRIFLDKFWFFLCVFLYQRIFLKNASLVRTVTPAFLHLWDPMVVLLCATVGRVIERLADLVGLRK